MTPSQPSLHVPAMQTWPAGQFLVSQPVSTQTPLVMLQVEPALQVRHLLLHGGWQAPFSHTRSTGQVTPSHAATQTPSRQLCPCGHMTPSQPPTQVPRWQTCPALHVLPMQSRSLHSPSDESQVKPTAQGNSLSSQKWRQTPWLQTSLTGQRSPSSTMPLQSLSWLSHFSAEGMTA